MRKLLSVVLAVGAFLVAGVVTAPSANAAGGERLGCYVASGQPLLWGAAVPLPAASGKLRGPVQGPQRYWYL